MGIEVTVPTHKPERVTKNNARNQIPKPSEPGQSG